MDISVYTEMPRPALCLLLARITIAARNGNVSLLRLTKFSNVHTTHRKWTVREGSGYRNGKPWSGRVQKLQEIDKVQTKSGQRQ